MASLTQSTEHRRRNFSKRIMAICLPTVCAAAFGGCSIDGEGMASNPRPFDADAWRADRGSDRCDMASDLARKIHEAVGFGVLRGSDVGSLGARRT